MSIVIRSLAPICNCGVEGVEYELSKLDTLIADISFQKLKDTIFDLKVKTNREDMFTLMRKRDILVSSINRLCKTTNIEFVIGIPIPPEPCIYD